MISLRPTVHLKHIYSEDPAIDKQHPDYSWDKYVRTGDRKYVPVKDGFVPTVFELRPLTRRQYQAVMRCDATALGMEAVAYGLVSVENLSRGDHPVVLKSKPTDLGDRLTDESLDNLFAFDVIGELGLIIISLSAVRPT